MSTYKITTHLIENSIVASSTQQFIDIHSIKELIQYGEKMSTTNIHTFYSSYTNNSYKTVRFIGYDFKNSLNMIVIFMEEIQDEH